MIHTNLLDSNLNGCKLKRGSEANITSQRLKKCRHADMLGLRYKMPDIGNKAKLVDVMFFSNIYGYGFIEIKVIKTKQISREIILSKCEPHQVAILDKLKSVGVGAYLGGFHFTTGIYTLYEY